MSARLNFKDTSIIINKLIDIKNSNAFHLPVMLWGSHGIGKTSLVRAIAKQRNMDCVTLNLANQSPEDLLGQIDGKGGYYSPNWINKSGNPTIYFLDELNRAPGFILQCMFNFILEGRLHLKDVVGKNDIVIAACNPPSEKYNVTEFQDSAFLSRFCHFIMTPEKEEFSHFLNTSRQNSIVQACLSKSKNMYSSDTFSLDWNGSSDNRNLERISTLIDILDDTFIENHGMALFSSIIGYDAASIIINEIRETHKIDFNEIVKTGTVSCDKNDISTLNMINTSAIQWLISNTKDDKFEVKSQQLKNIIKYVKFNPKDLQVSFLKNIKLNCSDAFTQIIKSDIDYFYPLIFDQSKND